MGHCMYTSANPFHCKNCKNAQEIETEEDFHEVSEIKEEPHGVQKLKKRYILDVSDLAEEPYKDDYSTCLEKTCIIFLYCIVFSILLAYWLVMMNR
jgi:hypothetical protein